AADLVDSEAEDDEDDDNDDDEDDDEDDDDDDDEEEPGQISISKAGAKADNDEDDEDDSDDEPVEAPIKKGAKETDAKKGGIPKIPIGRIPADTPKERIIFVSQLPQSYKHNDLVALFTKFGPIEMVNRIQTKAGGNNVSIAFESAESAQAAIAAKPKALTLNDHVVFVAPPFNKVEQNERTVCVGLIGPAATKEHLTEHFKSCGAIDAINFSNNRDLPHAYIRFKTLESATKALKLHGSEFNSRFITVRDESYKNKLLKKPKVTLTVTNTGSHESYKSDVIEKIFKKHGEVLDVDVVCTRGILAFVTYENEEQAQKAFKALNGKTVGDLEIKLEPYHYSSSARSILVTNLQTGIEEEEIRTLFSECGEIEFVKMLGYKSVIKFATDDAFCKSFLMNERLVSGQPIFIEPNSLLKHKIVQQKFASKKTYHGKRPNGGGKPAGGPGKFQKFGNNTNNKNFNSNNNNNNNNKKKPFNKRPAQENGNTSQNFKKAKQF
ncbi:hypothetical protein KR044_003798, partial [Drosophila immigrans]